jgi:hypothetical protein
MTDPKTKGLPCLVYRTSLGDASLGGASHTHDFLLVIGIDGYESIEEANASGRPVFQLQGTEPHYLRVVPLDAEPGRWAFGGNFVYATDSRFAAVSKYPLPIHDRDMTKERR